MPGPLLKQYSPLAATRSSATSGFVRRMRAMARFRLSMRLEARASAYRLQALREPAPEPPALRRPGRKRLPVRGDSEDNRSTTTTLRPGAPPVFLEPPNGWRVSGEPRSEAQGRVRCTRVLGGRGLCSTGRDGATSLRRLPGSRRRLGLARRCGCRGHHFNDKPQHPKIVRTDVRLFPATSGTHTLRALAGAGISVSS